MPDTDGPQPEPIGGLTSHRVLLGQLLDTWSMRLERNGIVERVVITTRPVAVEYRITPLGKTIPTRSTSSWGGWPSTSTPSRRPAALMTAGPRERLVLTHGREPPRTAARAAQRPLLRAPGRPPSTDDGSVRSSGQPTCVPAMTRTSRRTAAAVAVTSVC